MCQTAYISHDGVHDTEINTLAELRAILKVDPVFLPGYVSVPEDCCLCPCDIEATAARAGYGVEDVDCFGAWHLTAPTNKGPTP